ncbi:rCG32592, isoform CRA_c [Rattus norvegicus]|uniref:RCG32592, isoform CRA_c n=1 Tax=Rattus norvegicus TaxID=10116 RepID=A6HFW5_RAT|nr:rCG32592, isoform CRA_c [Rattus norvegicus]
MVLCPLSHSNPSGPLFSIVLHPQAPLYRLGTSPLPCLCLFPNPSIGVTRRGGGGDTIPPQASGKALPPWALPFPVGFLPDTFVKNQT